MDLEKFQFFAVSAHFLSKCFKYFQFPFSFIMDVQKEGAYMFYNHLLFKKYLTL